MASRLFNQFVSTFDIKPIILHGSFVIGTNGVVTGNTVIGAGLTGSSTLTIQQKGTGVYQMQFADPYNRIMATSFQIIAPVSTTKLIDGSSAIIVGKAYQIGATSGVPVQTATTVGSTGTNWYTLGLPTNQTPYVGSPFVATSAASQLIGSSAAAVGTGVVQAIGVANIDEVELIPDIHMQLFPTTALTFDSGPGRVTQNNAASYWFQTTISSSGAPVPATAGTTIRYMLLLSSSLRAPFNSPSTANLN